MKFLVSTCGIVIVIIIICLYSNWIDYEMFWESFENSFFTDDTTSVTRFLKVLGNKVPCKCSPNIWQKNGILKKMELFTLNWCWYFLGNFCRKLGYFLLQRLITLERSKKITRERSGRNGIKKKWKDRLNRKERDRIGSRFSF